MFEFLAIIALVAFVICPVYFTKKGAKRDAITEYKAKAWLAHEIANGDQYMLSVLFVTGGRAFSNVVKPTIRAWGHSYLHYSKCNSKTNAEVRAFEILKGERILQIDAKRWPLHEIRSIEVVQKLDPKEA